MFLIAQAAPSGSNPMSWILLLAIPFVFYFLLIAPQRKKDKERRKLLESAKKGDRIITIGGIHGEVESVKEDHVILLVDRETGTSLKMSRSAIHEILAGETGEQQTK